MNLELTEADEARYAELQAEALDCARAGDRDDMLAAMLAAGMPVNLADHKSNALLMLAAYHGHSQTVRLILAHGAEPDRRNAHGQTPLGGVAFKGYADIARQLIDAGADIEADQGGGMTPLMYAMMFGRTDVEKLLRKNGAGQKANAWTAPAVVGGWFIRLARNLSAGPSREAHARA
jgi:uncharacterized protein